MKLKLLDRKRVIGAAQGAFWAGLGMAATAYAGTRLRSNFRAIGDFTDTPTKKALVDGATGLVIAGLAAGALGRGKNASAGKKAAAYMGTGALLATVYPLVLGYMREAARPGGRRRLGPTVTQALPSTSASPSTAMLRAGGGIVMGAPAVDTSAAVQGLTGGRPGGRYINPRFQWSNIREL